MQPRHFCYLYLRKEVIKIYSYDFWNSWRQIKQLQKEIEKLKAENRELSKKIAALQPVQIEKMEYKINELIVETLSGTLNIGLSAHTDEKGLQKIIEKIHQEQDEKIEVKESSSETVD